MRCTSVRASTAPPCTRARTRTRARGGGVRAPKRIAPPAARTPDPRAETTTRDSLRAPKGRSESQITIEMERRHETNSARPSAHSVVGSEGRQIGRAGHGGEQKYNDHHHGYQDLRHAANARAA